MKIANLSLSNILSFPFVDNIQDAIKVNFDAKLNIIIGGNGSGKSTVLECISFIFKRVLFKPYDYNELRYRNTSAGIRQTAITFNPEMAKFKNAFRLNPNWQTENKAQIICLEIELDDLDKANMELIMINQDMISSMLRQYANVALPSFSSISGNEKININISLNINDDSFTFSADQSRADILFYLSEYELIREAIGLHNADSPEDNIIQNLNETFTMLSAFRNYYSFSGATQLSSDVNEQIRSINQNNRNRGINSQTDGEPSIFSVIKLRIASIHFDLVQGKMTSEEAETEANESQLLKNINEHLKIINLKCSIKVIDIKSWSYVFEFKDIVRDRTLGDINNLSAGQRSIIHLIFEAYGRGDMKGGVVVIDEPEIHLHYQFQYEYLLIINTLIKDLDAQYILVTHSDGFISSETAQYIKRFSLDENRHSTVYSPTITTPQKKKIEILDNKQSARAFFSDKIILVEGPDDRFFFRTLFDSLHPELKQEISIYDAGSRDSIPSWRTFFEQFGLIVYEIKDLDAVQKDIYAEATTKLTEPPVISQYRIDHPTLDVDIEALYASRVFILKYGPLEAYMDFPIKGIEHVIKFCEDFNTFLAQDNDLTKELTNIVSRITE